MKGHVLIVDDDQAMCELVDLDLRRRGYQPRWACDPTQALTELEQTAWDVVLTDLRMPGLGGIELCTRVQELRPGLPVVVRRCSAAWSRSAGAPPGPLHRRR